MRKIIYAKEEASTDRVVFVTYDVKGWVLLKQHWNVLRKLASLNLSSTNAMLEY